ncbi:neutral cholesterol ester hydrolase 1-like [Ruditapes philippinarum]|uniref:neutral cholesterol ester hydrolase 1-like n=1 Tax=Ruditapes philippinarum TaxID=129788 RepID=UPI00295B4E81|nr:neutral cholesterol ester hydrolase 1-like [Ruditapes philippinarum]
MTLIYFTPVIAFLLYRTTNNWKASVACFLYLATLTWLGVFQTLLSVSLTVVFMFMLFQYMHTEIPEGVKEVWGARILDTALRTNGKFILSLHNFGITGGCCRPTRKLVNVVLTTLITGRPFGLGPDPELEIYDMEVDGVSVRVYDPVNTSGSKRPVLVYYHGGGWSWLNVDVYDPATRELAKKVGMVVVSVNYRQSPEHPHPIPFNDCLKATEWVLKNPTKLKIDSTRVAISGDSAGGHLTAAVSLRLKKKIKIQIPIYPCLQLFDLQTPSYIENKDFIPGMLCDVSMLSYWLNYGNISYEYMDMILDNQHTSPALKKSKYADNVSPRWYMKEYIRSEKLREMEKATDSGNEALSKTVEKTILDPYFAPLMADEEDFKDLPHTYVLTAGYDVLRDDGLMYYQRCKAAGVRVHLAHYEDGFHGMIFFFAGPMPFKVGIRAMNDLVKFLKENL